MVSTILTRVYVFSLASGKPGASANDLTDDALLVELTGNAVLNGVPVDVQRVECAPAAATAPQPAGYAASPA